jgi:chemotaxis response regulator CheB
VHAAAAGQFHVPGIDATFESVAAPSGPDASASAHRHGPGRRAGLLAMRERGALTIGQDEATCAVYGMPPPPSPSAPSSASSAAEIAPRC